MQNTQPTPPEPTLDGLAAAVHRVAADALGAAGRLHDDGVGDGLGAVAVLLGAVDRLISAVITVLQAADHQRVIVEHGLTRDGWLRAVANRTGADAGMLLAAAERLVDMPAVTSWFHQGTLSWGAVRAIVLATRNLTAAQRGWVDDCLVDHGVEGLDGDQIVSVVDGLVDRARADLARDRESSAVARRWLALQPRLDGTVDVHGTLDAATGATALATFHAMRDTRDDHDHHGDGEVSGDAVGMSDGDAVRAARRRSNVDILRDLCRQRLTRHGHPDNHDDADAGGDAGCRCGAAPSSARPAFLVVADLAALDSDAPVGSGTAKLHWATGRAPVELTPAAARLLACDATLRAVITDGPEILGVTAAHPKVSATVRAALTVRDGGCRFPTCTQPADLCDAHHIVPVASDGATRLDNLALVCRDHHHAIHDSHWQVTLHTDGQMVFARRGVTLTSQPRVRRQATPTRPPPRGRPTRGDSPHRTADPPPPRAPATDPARVDDPPRNPADALLPF